MKGIWAGLPSQPCEIGLRWSLNRALNCEGSGDGVGQEAAEKQQNVVSGELVGVHTITGFSRMLHCFMSGNTLP